MSADENFPTALKWTEVLCDDILLLTAGKGMLHRFGSALDITHRYLMDMGSKIATDKSFNFASASNAAEWLAAGKTGLRTGMGMAGGVEEPD